MHADLVSGTEFEELSARQNRHAWVDGYRDDSGTWILSTTGETFQLLINKNVTNSEVCLAIDLDMNTDNFLKLSPFLCTRLGPCMCEYSP